VFIVSAGTAKPKARGGACKVTNVRGPKGVVRNVAHFIHGNLHPDAGNGGLADVELIFQRGNNGVFHLAASNFSSIAHRSASQ
jgi:hypothetical protein